MIDAVQLENYIKAGDDIQVMYRSLTLEPFRGAVVEVGAGDVGKREIIVVREGTTLLDAGAIGVREDQAVLSVRRGDAWVLVPSVLSIEEATEKAARGVVNEAKRIQRKVPLFANHIAPTAIDPVGWVTRDRERAEEQLAHSHARALESTRLRAQVEALVSADDFTYLCGRRERYPDDALYGSYFWRKQLEHIQAHGRPEKFQPPAPLAASLNLPWLKYGNVLTWTCAPGGPQSVRVLWVGPAHVLCQMTGEPIRDYDPRLIPERNVWLVPEDFAEFRSPAA